MASFDVSGTSTGAMAGLQTKSEGASNRNDGLYIVVKQDCPTCVLIEPVIRQLVSLGVVNTIYVQDDTQFLSDLSITRDDIRLEQSFHLKIDVVPTLLRVAEGKEQERVFGWHKEE